MTIRDHDLFNLRTDVYPYGGGWLECTGCALVTTAHDEADLHAVTTGHSIKETDPREH